MLGSRVHAVSAHGPPPRPTHPLASTVDEASGGVSHQRPCREQSSQSLATAASGHGESLGRDSIPFSAGILNASAMAKIVQTAIFEST